MNKAIINRVIIIATYIIETEDTIRNAAKKFKVSKSTVHKDLKERLYNIDIEKYQMIKNIMQKHIEVRHLRGGESTRQLFLRKRQVIL